jgi:hypothetical protein
MKKVKGPNPTRDKFGILIPNAEQLEELNEACALSKMQKLHEVASNSRNR